MRASNVSDTAQMTQPSCCNKIFFTLRKFKEIKDVKKGIRRKRTMNLSRRGVEGTIGEKWVRNLHHNHFVFTVK